jgi:group I intron endonuclease
LHCLTDSNESAGFPWIQESLLHTTKNCSPLALDLAVHVAPRRPGIYKLLNRESGKCYVGQASNLRSRLSTHLRHLKNGTHPQPILRKAFAKYGPQAWEFQIVEECPRAMLTERETFHAVQHQALRRGYNCAPIRSGVEPSLAFSAIARKVARNYHDGITDLQRSEIALRAARTRQLRMEVARCSEIAKRAAATRAANRLAKSEAP